MLLKLCIRFYLVQQQWFDSNLIYASWNVSRPMAELSDRINLHSIHFIHTLKLYRAIAAKLYCCVLWTQVNKTLNSGNCNDKFQLSIDSSAVITWTWIFHVLRVEWNNAGWKEQNASCSLHFIGMLQIQAIEMEINDLNFSSIRWYEVTAPAVIKNRKISTYRVDGSSVVLVVILLIVY